MINNGDELLRIENLKKYFPIRGGVLQKVKRYVKAVEGVNLQIQRGEALGLVGESGCGKTTLGRTILRLEEPDSGRIFFEGTDILSYGHKKLRTLRQNMQVIFQNPYSSLNFRQRIGDIIGEPFIVHYPRERKSERKEHVVRLMKEVGLRSESINRFPHEFSGGQRQRIVIARALALNPKLIVCDEPVSALDMSVQGQVLNLLKELQEKFNLTYLFISHDLSVVAHLCNRVAVMYLGYIVEIASKEAIFEEPLHPYTKALIAASPVPNPKFKKEHIVLEGDVPSAINPPHGCPFNTRCPMVFSECYKRKPELLEVKENHFVRCLQFNGTQNT